MSRGIDAHLSAQDVEQIIDAAVRERLTGVDGLVSVEVLFDEFESENVATVRVVIDPRKVEQKIDELRNLSAHIRRSLMSKGSDVFPLVRLLSKADLERQKAEARRSA